MFDGINDTTLEILYTMLDQYGVFYFEIGAVL